MIGWASDNVVVGPIAFAAKKSLLDFIPVMLPSGSDEPCHYRLVLEHGDYGIHNMSIQRPENESISVSSLFDWENGSIVPALLSEPTLWVKSGAVGVDENGDPKLIGVSKSLTAEEIKTRMAEVQEYITVRILGRTSKRWLTLSTRSCIRNVPSTIAQLWPAKMLAISGSHCKIGAAKIRRGTLVPLELGLRRG